MSHSDLTNNIGIQQTLDPDAYDVSADVACTGVDGKNCESVLHIVAVGDTAEHSTSHHTRLVIQESAVLGSAYTDVIIAAMVEFTIDGVVTAMEDITTGLLKALDAAGDDNHVYAAEYKGQSQYSRILLEVTGTRTVGDIGAEAIKWARSRNAAAGVLGVNQP